MKTTINTIDQITIEEFADREGFEMMINERPKPDGDPSRHYARFDCVEVMDRGCLVGTFGNGSTVEEAVDNYAKEISLKRLAFKSYTKNRREVEVPRLISSNAESSRTAND